MSKVLLKALRPTTYDNRRIETDGEFEASASDARVLTRIGRAEVVTQRDTASREVTDERSGKRKYRRRDMSAE